MDSCATCKHFNQKHENWGFCEYPVPAWLILTLHKIDSTDKAKMPSRYAPCDCYHGDTNETE